MTPPNSTLSDEDSQPPPVYLELIDPLNLLTPTDHTNITAWATAVFSQLQTTGSLRAKVVNDSQMSAAHKKFSNINTTTDVLTFDLNNQDTSETKTLDTDLLICHDQAVRQAQHHNHTPAHELLLYIIHGTLHCLGYNDHTPNEFKAMHDKEDQLLTAAGIGPLFHSNKENTQS